MKFHIRPWRSAVLLAFSALLVGLLASASASSAAVSTGWVSLANLAQTPSPVDVYLYSSGDSSPQFVQHDVAYGTILPYQQVNVGNYSVQMRTAGSSASSTPVWSVSLTVKAGGAYTVAPLRASASQGQLQVIDNNLSTPQGKSFVRVIQADINQKQVTFHCSCAAGAPGNITTDAAPGNVSPQVPIPTGTWTMTATGPSSNTSLPVTLTAGTVHTEIVIAAPGGGIEIINVLDAARRRPGAHGWRFHRIRRHRAAPRRLTTTVAGVDRRWGGARPGRRLAAAPRRAASAQPGLTVLSRRPTAFIFAVGLRSAEGNPDPMAAAHRSSGHRRAQPSRHVKVDAVALRARRVLPGRRIPLWAGSRPIIWSSGGAGQRVVAAEHVGLPWVERSPAVKLRRSTDIRGEPRA